MLIKFPKTFKTDVKIIYLASILFNFAGGMKLNFELVYYMLTPNITYNTCKAIAFVHALVFLIYRSSLIICLFYKVKVISGKAEKLFFGIFLILVRTVFQILHIVMLTPEVENTKCKVNLFSNLITTWGFVATDFIIELYLAFKVITIMNTAKKKSNYNYNNDYGCNTVDTYRVLNAVIFWYSIRILMAVLLNVATAFNTRIISDLHILVIPTLNLFICISMSLLLTYCKDIISYLSHLQNKE